MSSSRLHSKTENSVEFHMIWKIVHQEIFQSRKFPYSQIEKGAVLLAPQRERIPVWGELKVEGKEIAQGRGHCDDERSSQETVLAQICKVTFCRFGKRFFFVFTQRAKVLDIHSTVFLFGSELYVIWSWKSTSKSNKCIYPK